MNKQAVAHSNVVAVVSHDAGGAEILASYILEYKLSCVYILQGPAIKVFERYFGALDVSSLDEGLSICHSVICGTSWQSDLEWRAVDKAKKQGKLVVSFLDHWINYRDRFVRCGIENLPDEIWVGDVDAKRLAIAEFPSVPVILVNNPYFIRLQLDIKSLHAYQKVPNNRKCSALFVCENITDHANLKKNNSENWGYTEFDALEYFLCNISLLDQSLNSVLVRPHPSDRVNKYDYIKEKYPNLVRISDKTSLLEDIVSADFVVGCQSMAMVVGLLASKKVISAIPPSGRKCKLPQSGIVMLRDLLSI